MTCVRFNVRCQLFWQLFRTFHNLWHFFGQLLETFAIFFATLVSFPLLGIFGNFCNFSQLLAFVGKNQEVMQRPERRRREGRCSVRFAFARRSSLFCVLSFPCIYVCCGSMCSMGSMWVQQSYSAVLHPHLRWYYYSSAPDHTK